MVMRTGKFLGDKDSEKALEEHLKIGKDFNKLQFYIKKILANKWKKTKPIKYWDAKVGKRIIKILEKIC